tara:strand:- start:532 stop:1614 length:1083 start_codon:yes stop_codon:yes gene_type:complete
MARQDIAGLLTGVSSGGIDPVTAGNSEQQRLAFGAQRAQGLGRASRGLMGGNSRTPGEQLQMAMASLDLSKPEDLRKMAQLQQATGDLAGAAQTASKITAMEQAKIAATYAANQETRSALASDQKTEAFKLGKEDRLKQETKDAAQVKRLILQDTRAERNQVLREEQAAREKKRSEIALTDRDTKLAQEASLRTIYESQARAEGREELADAIKDGLSLSSVASILYAKTSTAAVTAAKGAEKVAFKTLLESAAIQAEIPEVFQEGLEWGKTSDEAEDLIFYKLKVIRQQKGNNITDKDAMLQAIKEVAELLAPPAKGLTPEEVAAQAAAVALANGTSTAIPVVPSSTDAFANIPRTGSVP